MLRLKPRKVLCPGCSTAMVPSAPKPVLFTRDFVEITYTCKHCGKTTKRTLKKDQKPT